jgi:hypothetical protein
MMKKKRGNGAGQSIRNTPDRISFASTIYRFQESILPNFVFLSFPIFIVKLECLKDNKKIKHKPWNSQAKLEKTKKYPLYRRNTFGRIGSWFKFLPFLAVI